VGTRDRIPPVVPAKAPPEQPAPPTGPRALRSLRVRITVAATVAFTVLFALTSFLAIARVNASLEDGLRADSQRLLSLATPQLESGADPRAVVRELGVGTPIEVLDANGNVIVAPPPKTSSQAVAGPDEAARRTTGPGDAGGSTVSGGEAGGPGIVSTQNGPTGAAGVAAGEGLQPGELPAGDFVFVQRQAQTPNGSVTLIARPSLDNVRRTISTLRWVLLLLVPLVAAGVAAIVWVVVDRALRPVDRLRAEVEQISHSTLTQRLAEPGTASEIDNLARTMNEMLDRLETSTVQQRRFVSDAGHELKTPLTTIRSTVEVAKSIPDPDWPAVADKVLASEQRLEALVDDLLTLARFDEGASATNNEPVDLEELVMAWSGETAAARAARDVEVDLTGVVAGRVQGDRRELGRLVGNLLDNAAHHADARVIVSLAREGDAVVLTVDDDGPGIPEAQRAAVFDRFVRVEESRRRSSAPGERDTGTGLGLAIARACALRHDGTIAVEDSALGGARFVVTLPAC
jgi:signal transduction histidine kinase